MQTQGGKTLPVMEWAGDPVSAIARFCQVQGWAFSWDPVEPFIDLRWFAHQWGVSPVTLRQNYTAGLPRIRTSQGIAYRASDLNRVRAAASAGRTKWQSGDTSGDG